MIVLITTLHTGCHSIRAEEYKTCLLENLKNPHIDEIRVLLESQIEDDYGFLEGLRHEKLKIQIISKRPFYSDLFACANQYGDGHIAIICNGDIYFDQHSNIQDAIHVASGHFWTLSRYNEAPDGGWVLYQNAYKGSHDCWIFRTPIRSFQSNYHLGIIGCDPIIAQRAIEAGLKVSNPCLSIYPRHLHRQDIRNHFLDQDETSYCDDKAYMKLGKKLYCAPPSTIDFSIIRSNKTPHYLFMYFAGRWILPFHRLPFIQKLLALRNSL